MEKTWKQPVAGIFAIIAGAAQAIISLVTVGLGGVFTLLDNMRLPAGAGAPPIILGIITLVGNIYALRRKIWGLALAGSICALRARVILGVLAIIFVSMGKREFS